MPSSTCCRRSTVRLTRSAGPRTHSRRRPARRGAGGADTPYKEKINATKQGATPFGSPTKEKINVPIFRDKNGQRRLHLVVDLGTTFRQNEITVQVLY